MLTVGCMTPAAPLPCLYTSFPHQAASLVTADIVASASQFSGHAAAAIAATLLEMNLSDFVVQGLARLIRATSSPVIETTPADLHNPTQYGHGISGLSYCQILCMAGQAAVLSD